MISCFSSYFLSPAHLFWKAKVLLSCLPLEQDSPFLLLLLLNSWEYSRQFFFISLLRTCLRLVLSFDPCKSDLQVRRSSRIKFGLHYEYSNLSSLRFHSRQSILDKQLKEYLWDVAVAFILIWYWSMCRLLESEQCS